MQSFQECHLVHKRIHNQEWGIDSQLTDRALVRKHMERNLCLRTNTSQYDGLCFKLRVRKMINFGVSSSKTDPRETSCEFLTASDGKTQISLPSKRNKQEVTETKAELCQNICCAFLETSLRQEFLELRNNELYLLVKPRCSLANENEARGTECVEKLSRDN